MKPVVFFFAYFLACSSGSWHADKGDKARKIEKLKWHCSTLCSDRGGVSDFQQKTLTCKCYVEKGAIDGILQEMLHKNTESLGMRLKLIPKINSPKRIVRQVASIDKLVDSKSEKFISNQEKNQTDVTHTKIINKAKLPPPPGVVNRLKYGNASTVIANRKKEKTDAQVQPPRVVVLPQIQPTTVKAEEPVTTFEQPGNQNLTTNAQITTQIVDQTTDSIVGKSRLQLPHLQNMKLIAIPPAKPFIPTPISRMAIDKFVVSNTNKIALEAAATQLNNLVLRVKSNTIDKIAFLAELQTIRNTLRTIDESGTRSRAAERAFEELRIREKERMQRFRELANRSKLSFGRSPFVGAALNETFLHNPSQSML